MQYLYKDADSFVFMDTDDLRPGRRSPARPSASDAVFMPEQHHRRRAVLRRARRRRHAAQLHRAEDRRDRAGVPRRHRHRHHQAGQDQHRRHRQRPAVHQRRRHGQDRHAHRAVPRARRSRLAAAGHAARAGRGRPPACPRWRRAARVLRRGAGASSSSQGFLEVETPARVPSPGQEVHLDAIGAERRPLSDHLARVPHEAAGGRGRPRIFQIGRCLPRRGEWSAPPARVHHRSSGTAPTRPWRRIADDCEALVRAAAAAVGRERRLGARLRAGSMPFERTTVAGAVGAHAGHRAARATSRRSCWRTRRARGGRRAGFGHGLGRRLLSDLPRPGRARDWPRPARRSCSTGPRRWRRWPAARPGRPPGSSSGSSCTLAVSSWPTPSASSPTPSSSGPVSSRNRDVAPGARQAVYPLDEKLLAALPDMPPTAGVALGFDRL